MLYQAALRPHPGADLGRLGGQVRLEAGEQLRRGVYPGHLITAPRQAQGLRPLAAATIDDPNGRWWQFRAQLPADEFLADHVPQFPQPVLPVPFPGGERGAQPSRPVSAMTAMTCRAPQRSHPASSAPSRALPSPRPVLPGETYTVSSTVCR